MIKSFKEFLTEMAKRVAPQIYMDTYQEYTYWVDGQDPAYPGEFRLYIKPSNLVKDNLDTPWAPIDIYPNKKTAMDAIPKVINKYKSNPKWKELLSDKNYWDRP